MRNDPRAMLTHLTARDFRNLEPLSWQPGAGSHLLLGGNGAGKTSLLEAVYALATTRSFRSAPRATRLIVSCFTDAPCRRPHSRCASNTSVGS